MVFVLVVCLILLSGAAWVVQMYSENVEATGNIIYKMEAEVANESAMQLLQYAVATGTFTSSSVLGNIPREFGVPANIRLDGSRYTAKLPVKGETTFSLQDLAGCFNLFFAARHDLARFLAAAGLPFEEVAVIKDSFADWKDSDDLQFPNGAERWYYVQDAQTGYKPRNSIFLQTPEEFSLIRGVKPEYMQKILPELTITPVGGYNIQTMGPLGLAAVLGISEDEAERLVALRRARGHFVTEEMETVLGSARERLTISGFGFPSQAVRFHVETVVEKARSTIRADVLFLEDELGPFRVLTWAKGL